MLISHEDLKRINQVQIELLKETEAVCRQLGISFFMVHGSLLGTVRHHAFVPDDDDIDIAMFREDYERFVKEAPKLFPDHAFVQTAATDPEYPLPFGKIRDSRTTYIVEEAKHLRMHHGIYIDVFPIDACLPHGIRAKWFAFRYKLLTMRIASVFSLPQESFFKKTVRFGARLLFPSLQGAIRRRDRMLTSCRDRGRIRMTGGKPKEQCMPRAWFATAVPSVFEGVPVSVPVAYDDYLTCIYGDYRNRTLIEDKISDANSIEINACTVNTEVPYTQYSEA